MIPGNQALVIHTSVIHCILVMTDCSKNVHFFIELPSTMYGTKTIYGYILRVPYTEAVIAKCDQKQKYAYTSKKFTTANW